MNRNNIIKLIIIMILVTGTGFSLASIGRFEPTHMIMQSVYCGSCHPEEVKELNATTHLAHFTSSINRSVVITGGQNIPAAEAISDGCEMCHNFWDNMKWFGVTNLTINRTQIDNPKPIVDIYGNVASPYGLSSTYSYRANISGIVSWGRGIDTYYYVNNGTNYSRLDYMWSTLSAISPGPSSISSGDGACHSYSCHSTGPDANIGNLHMSLTGQINPVTGQPFTCWDCHVPSLFFTTICTYCHHNSTTPVKISNDWTSRSPGVSCASAEEGLCHAAQTAVTLSETGAMPEILNTTIASSGVFFRHEMAYTTAQYAAKPVKLCGACHVNKLSPMTWGGEPWSQGVIEAASLYNGSAPLALNRVNNNPDDPFGFTPNYDMVAAAHINGTDEASAGVDEWISYKTPDWAHQNVPCMRCHVHAGINGVTVSNNIGRVS